MKPNQWFLIAAASLLILLGCGSNGFILPPQEGPIGEKHQPVIRAIAAQNEIGIGQMWKIYIHATDPDNDVDKIYVFFAQLGHGGYPIYPLVLPKPVREINGAVLTWTILAGTNNQVGPIYASAEIVLEDRAGNMSEPKEIEFTLDPFGPKDIFVPPPPFEKDLIYGQLTFPIQSDEDLVGDGGGDGRDD